MPDHDPGPICALEYRYGRNEVRALFSREARLRRALLVEAALAESEAEAGMIPREAANAIGEAARGGRVLLARVDELESELKHDVMALTRALAEKSGAGAGWVHYGATSNDITDTVLGLELQASVGVLRTDLTDLARALAALARTHRATPELGRTHGQAAVPLSFGYKMAVAAAEVLRQRRRLDQLLPRIAVGKMSGAVGTGAGFGREAERVERRVMAILGLDADEAPTQIVGRDRIAEFTNLLALVAGTAERLSTEVRNLQRTEIAEASEWFDETRQVGSSTMAQKRNPMLSENVTSLARVVRALALPPLESIALWHERDLTNSAAERIVVPHAVILTDDLLRKLVDVFTHLVVDPGRMARNLSEFGGSAMAEGLMLALTQKGLPRNEAHDLLRRLTRDFGAGDSLAERAKASPEVAKWISGAELGPLVDPDRYVKAAAEKTDRVLQQLDPQLTP
ncbi:MAG: adenylosuccinate lyase [Thermoplasmata archaeon]|nr:adenylosuccinate lyase [Thermoplasmata archaeon]MCI4359377.1 adenylosuccinate lyase [Thermoplasmata archaeon]